MVLVDLEKAFDCVWNDGLIHKMKLLKFPNYLTKLISSFLRNRTFAVNVNKSVSSIKSIPAGVSQGAVLSPTLYNIFTHDLPSTVETEDCEIAQLADDTGFYTSSHSPTTIIENLEAVLLKLSNYCINWNIKINF